MFCVAPPACIASIRLYQEGLEKLRANLVWYNPKCEKECVNDVVHDATIKPCDVGGLIPFFLVSVLVEEGDYWG